jgi:23S rRNA pseudouridine2457 synthase
MNDQPLRYFIINKPYNMVSQFIGEDKVDMLGVLDFDFPEGIHAVGRLDSNSEGLLILTTDKRITRLLFLGKPHKRTYWVRVKNKVTPAEVEQLRTGVRIRIRGGGYYLTPPCEVELFDNPPNVFEHQLELREFVPHSWLKISVYEGKYHQVRKMVTAIGHPCKRLVRVAIEDLELGDLAPGAVREIPAADFFRLLKIG